MYLHQVDNILVLNPHQTQADSDAFQQHQNQLALAILKKVDAESLRPPPIFQVNIKIQLYAARVSRLSFRFL